MSLIDAIKQPLEQGAPSGDATGEDMIAINANASRALRQEDVFVFPCVMANRIMSGHAIRMGDSSLEKFALDATQGTPYHIMHDRLIRNAGMTYAGHYDPESGESRAAVFLVRGRQIEAGGTRVFTNQEIADIQQGLRRDVSVGPAGPYVEWQCDLCESDMMSLDCPHIPGMKDDYTGDWATATIHNAHLCELSGVDRGAIPGAQIGRSQTGQGQLLTPPAYRAEKWQPADAPLETTFGMPTEQIPFLAWKADRLCREGKIPQAFFAATLERFHLADKTRFYSLPLKTEPSPPVVAAKKEQLMLDKVAAALRQQGLALPESARTDTPENFAADVAAAARPQNAHLVAGLAAAGISTLDALTEKLELAKFGAEQEAALRLQAKEFAVRAFDAETAKSLDASCENLPIRAVLAMADGWKKIGDKQFANQARRTAPAELPRSGAAQNDAPLGYAANGDPIRPLAVSVSEVFGGKAKKEN
jgi:hypothetical protein